ncbi:MAG: NUDIX domain-containing protein [Renibacterium sp.]|nr:NUDIX domain-containing protein [Renibacterium sp.]
MNRIVKVSAVAMLNADNELLTVRKRNSLRFQLPGGKPDPGESALQTAIREVREETGLAIPAGQLQRLGSWLGEAANDDADQVQAELYLAAGHWIPTAQAEIAELRWIPLTADGAELAPLLREFLLPELRARSIPAVPSEG